MKKVWHDFHGNPLPAKLGWEKKPNPGGRKVRMRELVPVAQLVMAKLLRGQIGRRRR